MIKRRGYKSLGTGTSTEVAGGSTPEGLGSDDAPVLESASKANTEEGEPDVARNENDHDSRKVVDALRQHGDGQPGAPSPEDDAVQQEVGHRVFAEEGPDAEAEELAESCRVVGEDEDAHDKEPGGRPWALVLVSDVVVPLVRLAVVEVGVDTYVPDVKVLCGSTGDVGQPLLHAASEEESPSDDLALQRKLLSNAFGNAQQLCVSLGQQRNTLLAPLAVLEVDIQISNHQSSHKEQIPRLRIPREQNAHPVKRKPLPRRLDLVRKHRTQHTRPSALNNHRDGPQHTRRIPRNQRRLIRRTSPPKRNK